MKESMLNYYRNLMIVVSAKDFASVDLNKVQELYEIAYDDVKNERRAKSKSSFKTDAEYRIYIIGLVECAGYVNLGIEPDFVTE